MWYEMILISSKMHIFNFNNEDCIERWAKSVGSQQIWKHDKTIWYFQKQPFTGAPQNRTPEKFRKNTGKHLWKNYFYLKKATPAEVFSCEFYEIF